MPFLSLKLGLFAFLSLADLGLTWYLLRHSDGAVYEGNPVARRFLLAYGWAGLAVFKAALVLLTAGICLAIARRRPRAAGHVLTFACATLAGVVLYSCSLSVWGRSGEVAEMAGLLEKERRLDDKARKGREYRDLLERLAQDLVARRRTLDEAVTVLGQSSNGRDASWLAQLREVYDCRSARESLAANLIQHAVLSRRDVPPLARAIAADLEADFRASYGSSPPRSYARQLVSADPARPGGHSAVSTLGPTT